MGCFNMQQLPGRIAVISQQYFSANELDQIDFSRLTGSGGTPREKLQGEKGINTDSRGRSSKGLKTPGHQVGPVGGMKWRRAKRACRDGAHNL